MNRLDLETPDFVAANAARLAELFPNCVTEKHNPKTGEIKRAIDFDLLRQELTYDLVEGPQERYLAPVAGKHAQQHRAHDIGGAAAPVACVMKRAVTQEFLPAPPSLQELEKEDQLTFACDGRVAIPFGIITSARRVQRPASGRILASIFGLTHRVSNNQGRGRIHALDVTSLVAV